MNDLKILVCVTDSESSKAAFRFACFRAKILSAAVEVLHVIDDMGLQNPFASETSKRDAIQKASLLLEGYVRLAENSDLSVVLNCVHTIGVFEDVVVKTIVNDGNIGMLVVGYSLETNNKNNHASSLLSKLGNALMIPMMIIPSNLTNQQIVELVR